MIKAYAFKQMHGQNGRKLRLNSDKQMAYSVDKRLAS